MNDEARLLATAALIRFVGACCLYGVIQVMRHHDLDHVELVKVSEVQVDCGFSKVKPPETPPTTRYPEIVILASGENWLTLAVTHC